MEDLGPKAIVDLETQCLYMSPLARYGPHAMSPYVWTCVSWPLL